MYSIFKRIYQTGKIILITATIGSSVIGSVFAQELSKEDKRTSKKASRYYKSGKINNALPLYMELADKYPNNIEFNYRTGICMNNTNYFIDVIGSVPYFENARRNNVTDTIPEIYYYLGHAYQILNRFEEAIECYKILKHFVEPVRVMDEGIAEIDENILRCEYGIQISGDKDPHVRIENLGKDINTKYAEYAPAVSPDGSTIYFTATRNTTTGGKSTFDGEYYEDIYVAEDKKKGRKWYAPVVTEKNGINNNIFHTAKNAPQPINSKYDDATLCMSADGNELYVFKDNTIYASKKSGDSWSALKPLNENVNLRNGYQSHISISADGSKLFLVSEQYSDYVGYDGFGGKDIYVCYKDENGEWGPPENLGENINSPWDEESPFLSNDGYLYFASRGHGNIGGYDIFRSKQDDAGVWSEPENVGLPINSGGDDLFYIETADGSRAYFSSERGEGYGDMDIYTIPLIPVTKFLAAEYENGNSTPIESIVKIVSKTNSEDTATFTSVGPEQLQEFYLLPNEKYEVIVSAKDYRTKSIGISIPKQKRNEPFYQEVNYQKIKDTDGSVIGQKTVFYNAFFNIDSAITVNPQFANIPNRDKAYSAFVKTLEESSVDEGFEIFAFTEYFYDDLAKGKDNVFAHLGDIQKSNDRKEINASLGKVIALSSNDSVKLFAEKAMATNDQDSVNFYLNKINESIVTVDSKTGIVSTPIASVVDEPILVAEADTEKDIAVIEKDTKETDVVKETEKDVALVEEPTPDTEKDVAVNESGTTTTTTTTTTGSTTTTTTKVKGATDPVSFEPALFGFDQFAISDDSKRKIDKVFAYLSSNKDVSVEIYGHTDSKGPEEYNERLSKKRAEAAVEYLVAKGISRDRLKAVAKGELHPIASNENPDKTDNPEGRRLNRRVEFKALRK